MKTGLKFIRFETVNGREDTTKINSIIADDSISSAEFDTEDNFKANANALLEAGYYCYYFGDAGDMKTNKQTVDIDGDNFNFLFNKSGSFKGAGKTGLDDKKYYLAGMLLSADKDDKYAVVKIKTNSTTKKSTYELLTTDDFLKETKYVSVTAEYDDTKYTEHYTVDNAAAAKDGIEYKLVNTSGSVQKGKNKAKDGNDRCYVQDGNTEKIKSIYVEN